MPNYFYIDPSGQKQGPIDDQQLQTLAAQGIITPESPLETESGYKGFAGQIPSLKFNTATSNTASPFTASTSPLNKSVLGRRKPAVIVGTIFLVLFVGWWVTSSKEGAIRKNVRADYKKSQQVEKEEEYYQQNHTKRLSGWRMATRRGIPEGEYLYGCCFLFGTGENQDDAEAFKWFRKAAEQGLASAQTRLGNCYSAGKGVEKDGDEAFKWLHKAAEQGHAGGQFGLALCYSNGTGVRRNQAEAVKWLHKSAQRDANNQYLLGCFYWTGNIVPEDEAEAAKWLRKAAAQGHEGAKKMLKEF